jgi:hypothetical protein
MGQLIELRKPGSAGATPFSQHGNASDSHFVNLMFHQMEVLSI